MLSRVYPRVCGGTPYHPGRVLRQGRSIPAYAGEPITLVAASNLYRVYPRVCGGTRDAHGSGPFLAGLSPRMRGNHYRAHPRQPHLRSIPAYAGEPQNGRNRYRIHWVYPRVCGGTRCATTTPDGGGGLSPRMRGNRQRIFQAGHRAGSIPAYAGEPRGGRSCLRAYAVYPRVCGGTTAWSNGRVAANGLSPRMRGNPPQSASPSSSSRSIPAYAGEPTMPDDNIQPTMLYPRVCGGTYPRRHKPAYRHGLSPRMRGNLPPAS